MIDDKPGREPDPQLLALISRARCWFDDLRSGAVPSIAALAEREAIAPVQVKRTLPFAFMALDLLTMIAAGKQPTDLTVTALRQGLPAGGRMPSPLPQSRPSVATSSSARLSKQEGDLRH